MKRPKIKDMTPLEENRSLLGKIHITAKQMLLKSEYLHDVEKASAEELASLETQKRIFRSIFIATEPSALLKASESEVIDLMRYVHSLSVDAPRSMN